jgi:predicted aspartyl protease
MVTLRAAQKSRKKYRASFLVDTGATDSMAPASELRRAGIRPRGRKTYEQADGSLVDYEYGFAEMEFMGVVIAGLVIFGPDGVEPLLGVTALESAGMVVDPVSQQLKRLPAVPLKILRVRQ